MGDSYKVVVEAKGGAGRALSSAQIDAVHLTDLKALAKERKQLFRDFVEDMARVYYVTLVSAQTNGVGDATPDHPEL